MFIKCVFQKIALRTRQINRVSHIEKPNLHVLVIKHVIFHISWDTGITHILIVSEEAVIYTPARGGKQLSEVLLADPETSVFRVCYWLDKAAERTG